MMDSRSRLFEIAFVLVHPDEVANIIVNADHGIVLSGETLYENQAPPA